MPRHRVFDDWIASSIERLGAALRDIPGRTPPAEPYEVLLRRMLGSKLLANLLDCRPSTEEAMVQSNPSDVLLAHNRWATAQIIDSCATLTEEQFHQTFEMGLGSLHDTVTHILGAMRGWTDVLQEREQRDRLEGTKRSIDELRAIHEQVADEFNAATKLGPHDGIVRPERGGRTFPFTRGGILTHVTTHGMHHRAQCINMLRQLGIEPDKLPNPSVLNWMIMVDPVE